MISVGTSILIIAIMAGVTFLTRVIPFILWGKNSTLPPLIRYLGNVLPFAMMGLLVVYCLRNTVILSAPYGIPELIAVIVVIGLHCWKRNNLISILGGTALYMFLIQVVFIA